MGSTEAGLFERLRHSAGQLWADYVGHRFVHGLADGSLPEAAFRSIEQRSPA